MNTTIQVTLFIENIASERQAEELARVIRMYLPKDLARDGYLERGERLAGLDAQVLHARYSLRGGDQDESRNQRRVNH